MKRLLCLFLVTVVLASACTLPAAPGPAQQPAGEATQPVEAAPAESEEQVTVVWWADYSDADLQANVRQYIVEPFMKDHPNIVIDFQPKGDYDRVLQTAMASGKGPDLYNTNGPAYSMQFAADGLALDLTPYVEKYGWEQKVIKWALDSSRYEGKVYSLPVTTETVFLFYNKTMFEKNGWKVPTTWDELDALCQEMQKAGVIPFAFGASDFKPANEWWLTLAFNYYAGRDATAKALRGELPWNSPEMVGAVERLDYMWKQGYITDKKSHEISVDDSFGLFGSQKAGMVGWATWLLRVLPTYSKDFEFDFAHWPVWRDGVPDRLIVGVGASVNINSRSDKKIADAAAEFLNYLVEDPKRSANITVAVNGELWIPVTYDPTQDFPPGTDPKFLKTIEEFNKIPPDEPGLSMWTFWSPEFEAYLYENIERVWLGQITAQQLMDEAQPIFERELQAGKVPPIPGK